MATGRLGTANLLATTITDVYTPTSTLTGVVNVFVVNRNASDVTVRIAISDTTVTQNTDEFIEYDTTVEPGKPLSITGLVLNDTDILTAYSSGANVSVVVCGVEESI